MTSRVARWAGLGVAVVLIFAAAIAIGLRLLPEPHREIDYLVLGSIATLVSLAIVFLVSIPLSGMLRRRPKKD